MTLHMNQALRRFIIPAMAAALLTFALLLAFAPPTEASYNGCRYDPDSISPIDYKFYGVTSDIKTVFRDAEATWDSTSAPGYFSHNGSASDPNIDVHDAYYADVEWAGLMSGSCPNDTGLWNSDEVTIEFNLNKMDDHTAKERNIIAMHEIGHAYGLSHVSTYCRLMKQGAEKFTCAPMPRPADVELVEHLYP